MGNPRVAELQAAVNKAMGKEVLYRGNDPKFNVDYISTGLLPFDILLQGGIPRGRFTTMSGDWSTLKSYVGLCAIAQTQQQGGVAVLIDTEHAYDPAWAASCGVDTDDLIVQHPDNGELAIDTAEAFIRGGADFILFDSVAATLPQAEQEKRLFGENVQPARQAALMSVAGRRLTTANSGRTAVMWINQLRENVGMTFGPREKQPGGRALPYYSSYMLETKKVGKVTRDEKMFTGDKWQNQKVQIGQKFKVELLKSKLNKPFREIWFDWDLTAGDIDLVSFLFTQGMEHGLITLKGSSYTFDGTKVVGKDKFKARLASDQHMYGALHHAILTAHGLASDAPAPKKPARARKTPSSASSKPKKTLRKA